MEAHRSRVILITGSSRGIGRYLAEYYIEKGFQVIGCSRRPIDFSKRNYEHYCLDIGDEVMVKRMLSQVRKTHGRLDVLINNAGVHSINQALLTPLEVVQEILRTNVVGTFLVCREAAKLMMKNSHGRILNISTIAVVLCNVGTSIYSASKACIEQFAKVLSRELASSGITVNTLGISIVRNTGMVENLTEDAVLDALNQTILKAPLDLQDIVHAVDFLISERSRMVTGQTLYLGGV